MRPPGSIGEVRAALMQQLAREPMTIRTAAQRSQVGLQAARSTIANAVRAGAVRECGQAKPAKGTRWEAIYEPAPQPEAVQHECAGDGWFDLAAVMGDWAR